MENGRIYIPGTSVCSSGNVNIDRLQEETAEERGRIIQDSFKKHTRSNKRLELQERKNV